MPPTQYHVPAARVDADAKKDEERKLSQCNRSWFPVLASWRIHKRFNETRNSALFAPPTQYGGW